MGRKPKVSKEIKVEICKAYDKGEGSFKSLAKSIGVDKTTVIEWFYRYKEHGEKAFDTSKKNNSYTKEFKNMIINEILGKNLSILEVSGKYNIHRTTIKEWMNLYYNGIEMKSYEPKSEVYTMKSRKTTFEERVSIVKEVIKSNMNYSLVAHKYNINYALVYSWTKKYLKDGEQALEYSKLGRKKKDYNLENLSEMERLKLELEKERKLRERYELQVELLKKKEELEKKLYRK